jgi:hypothetical protein
MTESIYTGGTTSQGPVVSANPAPSVGAEEFNYGIGLSQYNNIPSSNGVFSGTLSAQGNMIAMLLNTGGPKIVFTGAVDEFGSPIGLAVPWLTGYVREYWKNPSNCTFGANSAIPALTGVMPSDNELAGSMLYYVDLQLTRVSGSNYFDNFKFINNFNGALNWVSSSNDFILAFKKAEETNLAYYGYKTYQEFLSADFSKYKVGLALTKALTNVGKMVTEISVGQFGTVNSVAKVLIDLGLGAIGGLTAKLTSLGIPVNSNIYFDIYSQEIEQVLKTITKASDLETIQAVVQSTILNMTDPTDYISISKCSGLVNDSLFASFKEFGFSLYQNAPNFSLTTGKSLTDAIDLVLSESSQAIESLATPTSILPPDIIAGGREFLPEGVNNGQVSILNVIGTPSGYLNKYLTAVNQGIDKLDKSVFSQQLRTAFSEINTTYSIYKATSTTDVYAPPVPPDAFENFEKAKNNYFALVNTIANDPRTTSIVDDLNKNYNELCTRLSLEVRNFNKGNLVPTTDTVRDNSVIYSFVSSLPSYASDSQQLGTDFMLYNMCQDNQAGQLIKALLNQYKNRNLFSNIGVKDNSIL